MAGLIERMIEQNPHYGTGDEEDIGVFYGATRCYLIDAIFWRYRGRPLPGRAKKAIRRATERYKRKEERNYAEVRSNFDDHEDDHENL